MSPEPAGWPIGPDVPLLADDEVHVWQADLDVDGERLETFARLLVEDERTRAGRIRLADLRRRFVVARGFLRDVLARYLGVAPASLAFAYGARGKPALAAPPGAATLRFNLSHSRALALCAVARGREVGVDVEHVRGLAVARIAARFYSPAEQAALAGLPADAASIAFFRLWTCKEAYLKATGTGVSRPLAEVEVTLGDKEPSLEVAGEAQASLRWTVRELALDPAYVAALTVEGRGWRLTGWRWRPR